MAVGKHKNGRLKKGYRYGRGGRVIKAKKKAVKRKRTVKRRRR